VEGRGSMLRGVYVKKVLNFVFGWLWNFEIINVGREGDLVWVQGRLTIKNPKTLEPMIVKEQFGRADIKFWKGSKNPMDYGNDLKSAATDALKKCASELGVASDIYGAQEFKEIQAGESKKSTPQAVKEKPTPRAKRYECHESGCSMTRAEYDYSLRIFGKPFCRVHQKGRRKATPKKSK